MQDSGKNLIHYMTRSATFLCYTNEIKPEVQCDA